MSKRKTRNRINNSPVVKPIPGQMYLHLYHGRDTSNEQMYDWDKDGPMIGPLEAFIDTYRINPRILFCRVEDERQFFPKQPGAGGECLPIELDVVRGGLIHYDGVYYGDYEVVMGKEHG